MEDFIKYALLNNPGVEAAFQDYLAAFELIDQVTALPDPKASYRYYFAEVETRLGPQEHAFGVAQTLPWFGKLELQGEAAAAAAEAARHRFEGRQDALISEVVHAYLEYYHLGRAVAIVKGNRDLVMQLIRVAQNRYGGGARNHPDVIRAQVELGLLEDRLASLVDRRGPFMARLNATLNRPARTEIAFPSQAAWVPLADGDDEILAWIAEGNPELAALHDEMEAARATARRASRDFYPDFTFGVDYIVTGEAASSGIDGSGDDAIIAGIALNIPLNHGKYRAAVRGARAKQLSASLRRTDLHNRFLAEAATALFRVRDAERQIDLYRDTLLPKARESLNTTQAAFASEGASFTDLIDAQRTLLAFELSYERAIADHGQWRAEIERLVGRSLPGPNTQTTEDMDHEGEE